jgi:hypothetical protein
MTDAKQTPPEPGMHSETHEELLANREVLENV